MLANKNTKDRILGLDMIRSLAVLLIVFGHGLVFIPPTYHTYYSIFTPPIDGVSIFFVLSGFLIGNILLKIIKTTDFKFRDLFKFWTRRWFRTLPAYFLVLFILIFISSFRPNILSPAGFSPAFFFFSQNLFTQHDPLFFPESWSLSVEEWFYFLIPLTYFLFFKLSKNKKLAVLIPSLFFLLAPLIIRAVCFHLQYNLDTWDVSYRKIVVFKLDCLMYGIIGAYLYKFKNKFWSKYKYISLTIGLNMFALMIIFSKSLIDSLLFTIVLRPCFESLAVLLVLPYFSKLKTIKNNTVAKIITLISLISYSMYLVNLTLVREIMVPQTISLLDHINLNSHLVSVLRYFIFWFYTLSISYLLYRFYEKPITDLRDKLNLNPLSNLIKLSIFFQILFKKFKFRPLKTSSPVSSSIIIVTAINEKFAMPFACMLASLQDNLKSNKKVDLYVLESELSHNTKSRIESSVNSSKINLIWTHIDPQKISSLKISGHITIEAYFRLLISNVLPKTINKILYLDSDLIINTDISRLWETPFQNASILASPESEKNHDFIFSKHGPNLNGQVFNSGVLLIDLKKWRQNHITQKIITYLKKYNQDIVWHDQEGLNAIFADNWTSLSIKWNLLTPMVEECLSPSSISAANRKLYRKSLFNPYIIHFNTCQKPWDPNNKHPYRPLFYYYLDKTDWKGWRPNKNEI